MDQTNIINAYIPQVIMERSIKTNSSRVWFSRIHSDSFI